MAQKIQLRRDTAADWTSANPTLAEGEIGVETDTDSFKIGDGATAWTSLSYFTAGGGGAIRVEEEGTSTVAAATALNFVGAGVTVTDGGSNEATITISGGSSTAADVTIADAGANFVATDVEEALAELADGTILDSRYVQTASSLSIVVLTQAQYDALTPDGETLYLVVG
jgi:hypothetical protein